jgi:hypothetical protein
MIKGIGVIVGLIMALLLLYRPAPSSVLDGHRYVRTVEMGDKSAGIARERMLAACNGQPTTYISSSKGIVSAAANCDSDLITFIFAPSNLPFGVDTVYFMIESVYMESAQLTITEGSVTRYSCVNCASGPPPPPFHVALGGGGSSITITCAGKTHERYSDANFPSNPFTIHYVLVPSSGNRGTPQNMDFDVTLGIGYGSVEPLQVSSKVPADVEMIWRVDKTEQADPLVVSLSNFAFDSSCAVSLQIYDGLDESDADSLIFSGCEQPLNWLYAHSRAVTILTRGATSRTTTNFKVTWSGIDEARYNCGAMQQPDSMQDVSMMLDDGTSSIAPMKTADQLDSGCRWRISPVVPGGENAADKTVTLLISRSTLKTGSFVRIYDGSDSNSPVLWRSDRIDDSITASPDNVIVPPPLIAYSGNMYVYFWVDLIAGTSNQVGWAGEYMTDFPGSTGMGSGISRVSSSSALNIRPPGDGVTYNTNSTYRWLISPDAIGPITFVFNLLNISDCGNGDSGGDSITLYNGNSEGDEVLATFCGTTLPRQWYTASANEVLVVFESNGHDNLGTFDLSFFSDGRNYHCGFPNGDTAAHLRHHSMHITDGSRSNENIYPREVCDWRIDPEEYESLYIYFERFDVFGGQVLMWSENEDGSRELLAKYGDTREVPPPVIVTGKPVRIRYNTTSTVSGKGFGLTYFSTTRDATGPGNGLITARASLTFNLPFPVLTSGAAPLNQRVEWLVAPTSSSANGQLYFIFADLLRIVDCDRSNLTVYSGNAINPANVIGTFCADNVPTDWIAVDNQEAYLVYDTDATNATTPSDFELSYYTDGANTHCGISQNPARLHASSSIITDGSAVSQTMEPGQYCQWLVEPYEAAADAGGDGAPSGLLHLDLTRVDLRGATVNVWDGDAADSTLLWRCRDCQLRPRPIVSPTGKLFVTLQTDVVTPSGQGFSAVYSTVPSSNETDTIHGMGRTGRILLQPQELNINTDVEADGDVAWHVFVSDESSELLMSDFYTTTGTTEKPFLDGRPRGHPHNDTALYAHHEAAHTCGTLYSTLAASLRNDLSDVVILANQGLTDYVSKDLAADWSNTRRSFKTMEPSESRVGGQGTNEELIPAGKCKFILTSGSYQAFTMQVKSWTPDAQDDNPRLKIHTGLFGNDLLAFDSWGENSRSNIPFSAPAIITAPCGRAVVIMDSNASIPNAPFEFDLSFQLVSGDPGGGSGVATASICHGFWKSLQPKKKETDYLTPIITAASALMAFIGMAMLILYVRKHWRDPPKRKKKYTIIVPHPPFTPRLDSFRNKFFLSKGQCSICRDEPVSVIRLKCSHKVCMECLKGYMEAALGDISMFPVKCPMHYEGCGGEILAGTAKRVLAKSQYSRFLEFHDRATYGDGMRCIFCNNFVNFPLEQNAIAMVECPYCIQKFCIRCKKPWHYGNRCPLEQLDDGLSEWKKESGASSCPACRKIIEKDDPDTCHHMIHKVTDSIPCIRERTDFCYLCGTEVAGDYPHIEIDNPSVNHFPDGVFQKCRKAVKLEREAERDRIRKERRASRKTSRGGTISVQNSRVSPEASGLISEWDDGGDREVVEHASSMDRMWGSMGVDSPGPDRSPGSSAFSSPNLRRSSPTKHSGRITPGN